MRVRLACMSVLEASVEEDVEHILYDKIAAINSSVGDAVVKEKNLIDLVDEDTPSSTTPVSPPIPKMGIVRTHASSKGKNRPITKKPRTVKRKIGCYARNALKVPTAMFVVKVLR